MTNVKLFKPALPKRSQLISQAARRAVIELAPQAVQALEELLTSEDGKVRVAAVKLVLERVFPAARDDHDAAAIARAAAAGGAAGATGAHAHMAALVAKATERQALAIEAPSQPVPALPKGRNNQSDQ